jgi:hypothetical protein
VDAELAAGRANDDPVLHDEGGDGRGLTLGEVRDPSLPQLLARRRRDRDGVPVQQVVHDLSVGVEGAAVDRIAAGDAEGIGIDGRTILPLQRVALPGEVEGVEHVRVRRDDVHRVVDHERLTLVPTQHPGREGPHRAQAARVGARDLPQVAVARGRVVLARHGPVAALRGAADRQQREQG